MKKGYLTVLMLAVAFGVVLPAGAQWAKLEGGLPDLYTGPLALGACDDMNAVFSTQLLNDNSRKAIFITHDGGESWQELSSLADSLMSWLDVAMVSGQHIVAAAPNALVTTLDGGTTWNVVDCSVFGCQMMNYVEMLDSQNGVAMGDGNETDNIPIFLKTADGGLTWESVCQQAIGRASYDLWRPLDFVSSDVGFFSPFQSTVLYKTSDGGQTWENLGGDFGIGIRGVFCRNEQQFMVGTYEWVRCTTDGGLTWHVNEDLPLFMVGGFAPDDGRYVWGSNGLDLYFSADSGKTWTLQLSREEINDSGTESLRDLVLINASCGWLVTSQSIFRTVNGGGGVPTAVGEKSGSPVEFDLHQNYPNPFNPETQLSYTLHKKSEVSLDVFDVKGRLVRRLVSGSHGAGLHQAMWDGCDASGGRLPSGVYIAKLTVGEQSLCRKMQMVK